jgi:hypothetical protein
MPTERATASTYVGAVRGPSRAQALRKLIADERALVASVPIAVAILLVRALPDLRGLPYHADETVSGLVAARPFGEMLDIVVNERGGPPVHYVLAHVALAIETSATSLRALSLVAALAALPFVYDLGRRLDGPTAGAVAVLVAAASPFMDIYASFGRPYGVFVLLSAIALDLFLRAVQRPTLAAAALAAAAAVLAAGAHTFGFYLVLVEGAIGLALWRFRPARGFVVVAGAGLLAVPFVISAERLSDRFGVAAGADPSAQPDVAARQVFYALMGSSAGRPLFWALCALALGGLVVLARKRLSFAALAVGLLLVPPAAYMFLSIRGGSDLDKVAPRHLILLLPLWTVLIGIGFARLSRRLPTPAKAAVIAGLTVAVALTPIDGVFDPRVDPSYAANNEPAVLAAPARAVEQEVESGDALYAHATVFLAALEATERGALVIAGAGLLVEGGFERVTFPAPGVVVAVPVGRAEVDEARLENAIGAGTAHVFDRWVVVRLFGPFSTERAALERIAAAQAGVADAARSTTPGFAGYLRSRQLPVCRRLSQLGARVPACASAQ